MRWGTVTARLVVVVLAVALAGCVDDGEPGPSRSTSPDGATGASAAPADADDLDALIVACDEDITAAAELAAVAARRSMGIDDPQDDHDDDTGDDAGDERMEEVARREARQASRTAANAVTACLQQTTELAAGAGPTPDRRLGLVQSRLRDLSRALGVLEQALQEGEAVHQPARTVMTALDEWQRLAGPLRRQLTGSPDDAATAG